jgi:dTDP-4-dehydrorhamnose 3,5-epimerase
MTQRFSITDSKLKGVRILQRLPRLDARGYFERMFCAEELHECWAADSIAQVNHTRTLRRGTVRGMHFQYPPHQETKLVSCLRGEVFDVAVDVRSGSPTFLQWHAERLSEDNHRCLLVPKGCAHGFQTLTDDCELLYFHSAPFSADSEGGLHPLDPALGISWPLEVGELSARDSAHSLVNASAFRGVAA